MSDLDPNLAAGVLIWFLVVVVAAIGAVSIFGYILFKAGQLSHPAPLITSMSILTAVALIGALIGHDTDAYNLAAVGIGALAGSLAVVYRSSHDEGPPPPKKDDEGPTPKQGGDDAPGSSI